MGILRFQSQNTVYTEVSIRIFGVNGVNLSPHASKLGTLWFNQHF